jgi:hypothetical protein
LTGECEECKNKRLQTKLTIGASNDPLEQEADRVADQVLATPAHSAVSATPPRIQRFTGQASAGASTAPATVDSVLASSGRPLDPAIQQDMGQRFGHDFSQVRVHTGAAAEQSAREVNAHAYTVGHNIVFDAGRFAPGSLDGRRLIAHELTHVVQQTGSDEWVQRQNIAARTTSNRYEHEADNIALYGFAAPANENGVRDHIGKVLGFDFSAVRVHREAAEAESQGAHAVATGGDIYLAPGRFRPDLPLGRALLAHELAHVAQQDAAPRLPRPGVFREALKRFGSEYSSDRLAERAGTLADPQPALTRAPLGMQQRCVAGCNSCSRENDSHDAGTVTPASTPATASTPTPTHAVGPSAATAGPKVVRLSWTVDDGPTPLTPGMSAALSPRAATWFVMSNQLGTGTARTTALSSLVTRQTAGDEIGIHSMHPIVAHSAWFPINLGTAVPKGYTTTAAAMTDLTSFTGELRTAGLNVHFGRMPGGELSEVKKYVEDKGGAASTSESVAQALITGATPPVPAPASVSTDVALVMSTLRTLNLHLWGGSASGPEVTRNTWEAESSGVPARTNDVVTRFRGVVDNLANGKRTRPGSFVILAHDTTSADVTQAGTNITAMETYATRNGVRVEYYRMADLYQLLRGTPP